MSYDILCAELAETFLEPYRHSEHDVARLAQRVQDEVEDWLANAGLDALEPPREYRTEDTS